MKKMIIVALSALFLMYGCEKNPTDTDDTIIELSDEDKMAIISAEVSSDNGGMMADLEMASATATTGQPGSLKKEAGYDTTFTTQWITYTLSFAFYTADGREQLTYVENLTDRMTYISSLTGNYNVEGARQSIQLEKGSNLTVSGMTTSNLKFNGTSTNNSTYTFDGLRNDLAVTVESAYTVTDLAVAKNPTTPFPTSGKLECSFKGDYYRDGIIKDKGVAYNFNVTIQFSGGSQVNVTLPGGAKFTLDLASGDYSEME
ncbi:MAG: hypothetical protein ACOY90_15635 [Candidatus Zhuqueibacterota bacterium]